MSDLVLSADSKEFNLIEIVKACQSIEDQLKYANNGVIEYCVKIMTSESSKDESIEQSLWTLIHLVRRSILDKTTTCIENQNRFKDHISVLVKLVESSINKPKVVYASCVLMMILASDNDDNQRLFGEAGATKLVIDILESYRSDQSVLEFALRCVRNFSAHDEVAGKLTEDGVGEKLQQILTADPPNSVAILEAATWAVVNLSYDEDVAALLGSVGCCSAIISAYSATSLTPNGKIAFCWAVRNLSCPSLNIGTFAKSNVAALILDILKRGEDDYDEEDYELLSSAIWCVNNLTCSVALLRSFIDLGAAELLVSLCRHCMENFEDDIKIGPIAEATVFTLRNLSSAFPREEGEAVELSNDNVENVNQSRLGALGSIELVKEILIKYLNRDGMVENCYNTLRSMCGNHLSNQCRAGETGVFQVIFQALAFHKDILDTTELGLKCLIALISGHSANVDLVCDLNGVSLVVEYMKHHRTDYDVCTASCELLLLLHYRSEEAREDLKTKNQLSEDGLHARPAGRFDDIAEAWKIESLIN